MRIFFFLFLFLLACNSSETEKKSLLPKVFKPKIKKVGLQPYAKFPESNLLLLQTEIQSFYNCEVSLLPAIDFPQEAWYAPRSRYRADSLIAHLRQTKPDSLNYVIGLSTKDISSTKEPYEDWGILGLGYCPGPSCVVSTFRLKGSAKNQAHLEERLIKVTLHELGHNFGLPHCNKSDSCLMRDAGGTVKTVDQEAKVLCDFCRRKL